MDAAPPRRTAVDDAIAEMIRIKDELCGCPDPACANRVSDQLAGWSAGLAYAPGNRAELTDADLQRIAAVREQFARCMTRAVTSGAGSGSTP